MATVVIPQQSGPVLRRHHHGAPHPQQNPPSPEQYQGQHSPRHQPLDYQQLHHGRHQPRYGQHVQQSSEPISNTNYNSNNSTIPSIQVSNESLQFNRNHNGRPLSYNEPRSHRTQHSFDMDYPISDSEQYHVRSRSQSDRLLMPPPLPPARKHGGSKDSLVSKRRERPPEPLPVTVSEQRRSYASEQNSRASSPGRGRLNAHSRGNSLSDNDLLQFALNVESELPVVGAKRHSHASQSGSNRNSYVGDGGGSKRDSYVSVSGSKRNSYASGGSKRNSYVDRERRRSRGISLSEQELEGLISSLTNYPDNQDPSSQRSSLVVEQVMSQRGSYADGGHHTRTLSGESQYSEGGPTNRAVVGTHRFFVQPMNLCEPEEDILGYTQLCAINIEEFDGLIRSKLNQPLQMSDGRILPSFNIRLWSRASGRYLSILRTGAALYARAEFQSQCHLRMVLMSKNRICLMSNDDNSLFVQTQGFIVNAKGDGGSGCEFTVKQNDAGYFTLESVTSPGHYLGVRENGNIMPANQVYPQEVTSQFIIQKAALDLL